MLTTYIIFDFWKSFCRDDGIRTRDLRSDSAILLPTLLRLVIKKQENVWIEKVFEFSIGVWFRSISITYYLYFVELWRIELQFVICKTTVIAVIL